MRIYNTLSRKKDELKPLEPNKISMYVCGPTVYDYFHVGNARPFVVYDAFRRYLTYRGFEVKYVMNLTDVDDKIIKKANEQGVSASEIAEKYTQAFFEDIEKLGIKKADYYPRATESIPGMIKLIEILVDKGIAYVVDGDVFYEVAKFKDYGKLSGKNIEDLKSGARIEVDERKKSPLDFALWKVAKPGEPYWESPWGKGRPGWHIECSVMSMSYLGETIDIHAGGSDLIFPHHENEIAQSEGATGKPFARYWMHNGFLNIEGEKMSKSLGNFFTAREIMKKYHPAVIRMFFLLKHYRSPINFSEERIREAQQALQRISTAMENIKLALNEAGAKKIEKNGELSEAIQHLKQQAIDELDDDFNTAGALASIFDLVREANLILNKGALAGTDLYDLSQIKKTIEEFDQFLGILSYSESKESSVAEAPLIELLIDVRKKLREAKQWALADEIRDQLLELGIELKDRPDKTTWHRRLKS
ncbi:cysteine--tRNA ligase [candidate division KSB1 bacterium 4484_87]|nr:MAG: cysteine--tRNA ligase [candidate division KSB1 bacterium 4484_87]